MYIIYFTKTAEKQKKLLKTADLEKKTKELLNIIEKDPFQSPPPYEKLVGDLKGKYSRRINITHRLVYSVEDNIIRISSMWTHYEK